MSSVILMALLLIFINKILFAIESLLCRLCDVVYTLFKIYAGIEYMTYDGEQTLFLNVFFENPIITTVYNGMCAISIALAFAFATISVIKKLFDSTGERVKMTYGMILVNLFKSILLMILMTLIVSATIYSSSVLMQQIEYLFNNAGQIMDPDTITFTESDFGYMYDVLSTVGNHTINPEEDNRYNINSCFNEMRTSLQQLEQSGVFNYNYAGAEDSWQYAILQIYKARSIDKPIDLDESDDTLTYAIQVCGRKIKYGGTSFAPISSYTRQEKNDGGDFKIGRVIMLCGTMRCARNGKYNGSNASVYDGLRSNYLYGYKDAYGWDDMDDGFDIGLFSYDHLTIIVTGFFVFTQLVGIMFNAIARVFNIILLYLTAPPFLAVMPLDDGAKFKEWTTAFVIQTCTLFGSFIAVRLMMIFIPIIMNDTFVIFESSSFWNYMAKLLTMAGVVLTTGKASGMVTGILAGNAGMQAIQAGDIGSGIGEAAGNMLKTGAMAGAKLGWKVGKGAVGAGLAATGLSTKADLAKKALGNTKVGKALGNLGNWTQAMRDHGGIKKAWGQGMQTKEQQKKAAAAKNSQGGGLEALIKGYQEGGVEGAIKAGQELMEGQGEGDGNNGGENGNEDKGFFESVAEGFEKGGIEGAINAGVDNLTGDDKNKGNNNGGGDQEQSKLPPDLGNILNTIVGEGDK